MRPATGWSMPARLGPNLAKNDCLAGSRAHPPGTGHQGGACGWGLPRQPNPPPPPASDTGSGPLETMKGWQGTRGSSGEHAPTHSGRQRDRRLPPQQLPTRETPEPSRAQLPFLVSPWTRGSRRPSCTKRVHQVDGNKYVIISNFVATRTPHGSLMPMLEDAVRFSRAFSVRVRVVRRIPT